MFQTYQISSFLIGFKLPIVSIVIPTFNSANTIKSCIESCIKYANFCEVIIQDGNSQDATIAIVKSTNHPFLSYYIESDKGVYDAMNKAILKTSGKYIYFLGSDDLLTHGFSEMISVLHGSVYSLVYANVRLKYRDIVINQKRDFRDLLFNGNISHQGIFYHKCIFLKYKYNLSFPVYADYHLNLKIWCDKTLIKNYVNIEVCVFNDRDGLTGLNTPDYNFHTLRERLRKKYKKGVSNKLLHICKKII